MPGSWFSPLLRSVKANLPCAGYAGTKTGSVTSRVVEGWQSGRQHGRVSGLVAVKGNRQVSRSQCTGLGRRAASSSEGSPAARQVMPELKPAGNESSCGRVAEWSNAPVLKTGRGASLSWVRIPPLPPTKKRPLHGAIFLLVRGCVDDSTGSTSEHCSRRTPEGRFRTQRGMIYRPEARNHNPTGQNCSEFLRLFFGGAGVWATPLVRPASTARAGRLKGGPEPREG